MLKCDITTLVSKCLPELVVVVVEAALSVKVIATLQLCPLYSVRTRNRLRTPIGLVGGGKTGERGNEEPFPFGGGEIEVGSLPKAPWQQGGGTGGSRCGRWDARAHELQQ